MIMEIYYKDPDTDCDATAAAMKEKYPNAKPYSQEFWDKQRELMKDLAEVFGSLVSGKEDLYISVDTDNPKIVNVNESKYRLVT